jgi:IS4 transposase
LFFKALKQTLKIKTFVGTSANAVRTQVWTALIAMLVLKYLQLRSRFSWSLSNLGAVAAATILLSRPLGMVGRSISGSTGVGRGAR